MFSYSGTERKTRQNRIRWHLCLSQKAAIWLAFRTDTGVFKLYIGWCTKDDVQLVKYCLPFNLWCPSLFKGKTPAWFSNDYSINKRSPWSILILNWLLDVCHILISILSITSCEIFLNDWFRCHIKLWLTLNCCLVRSQHSQQSHMIS